MAKKTDKKQDRKEIKPDQNNKWALAYASDIDDIKFLLGDDYEPFTVDNGRVWFKKK